MTNALPSLSTDDLTRLFGAARTLSGKIGDVERSAWWRAFLLTFIETGISARHLLRVRRRDFDCEGSLVNIGLFAFRLSDRTAGALRAIAGSDPEFLFARDAARNVDKWSYLATRAIARRARIPAAAGSLLRRLRSTLNANPLALDDVNLDAPFEFQRPSFCSNYKTDAVHSIAIAPAFASRSLRTFFESRYVANRLSNLGTARVLRAAVNRLCDFAACEVTLDQLSDGFVESYIRWMAKAGFAPHTLKTRRGGILSIWRYAHRKRMIEILPRDIDPVKVPKIEPEAWSVAEIGRLLDAAAVETGHIEGLFAADFWTALIHFLFDTGLRIQAALAVKSADLDLEGRWVKARFDTQKQNADQSLPLSRPCVILLAAISPASRELVFPWRQSINSLTTRLKHLLRRAGLPWGRRDLFHRIRRTNGTYVCDASDEYAAMRQLGHSSIQMTRRYIDRRKLSAPRVVDAMQQPHFVPVLRITHDETGAP